MAPPEGPERVTLYVCPVDDCSTVQAGRRFTACPKYHGRAQQPELVPADYVPRSLAVPLAEALNKSVGFMRIWAGNSRARQETIDEAEAALSKAREAGLLGGE